MMKLRFLTLLGVLTVLLLLLTAASASAELTPKETREAEAVIKQFSAREFAARQKAVEDLIKMGPDVLPLIRKTLAETDDGEVKLRCEMVITGLTPKRPPASAKQMLTEAVIKDLGPPAPLAGMELRRTANGESRAYVVKRGAKMLVVHNGKEGQEYDLVRDLSLSPNGSRVAYAAYQAGHAVRFFMVCDGLEGPLYAQVRSPVFSPDSKRTLPGEGNARSSSATARLGRSTTGSIPRYSRRIASMSPIWR